MNEEVLIRFGVDSSSMASGLRSVERSIEKSGEQLKERFKEIGRDISSMLLGGGIMAAMDKVFEKVQRIKRESENLGVSTDFIQNLENIGRESGISGEAIEKMLNKFSTTVQAGDSVEDAFNRFADSIAQIEDPVQRIQAAIEVLGEKMGPKFAALLSIGADGIKKYGDELSKLSEGEIKAVEEGHNAIERLTNTLVTWTGKTISAFQTVAEAAGTVLFSGFDSGVSFSDALEMIKNEREAQHNDKAAQEDAVRVQTKAATLAQKQKEEAQAWMDYYKELDDLEQKQRDRLYAQSGRVHNAMDAVRESREAPYRFSLEDLASEGSWQRRRNRWFWSGPNDSGTAADIIDLRNDARMAYMNRNFARGDELRNRADQAFDTLAKQQPWLVNPQEKLVREANKQTALLEQMYTTGVKVTGADQ